MEDKTLKKIKAFAKKNPFPSYEFIRDMLFFKGQQMEATRRYGT